MSSRESLRDQAMRWRLLGCVYRGSYVVETRDVSLGGESLSFCSAVNQFALLPIALPE